MIDKNCVHQIQKRIISHVLPDLSGDMFDLFEFENSALISIIKVEYLFESISSSDLTGIIADDINKIIEGDLFADFPHGGNDVNNILISLIKTKFFKDFADFGWIDLPASIFVEDKESLS